MSHHHSQLRRDQAGAPPFLMVEHPPSSSEIKHRLVEWLLAMWMHELDPNIMGVRHVDEEKNGTVTGVVHIAVPLGYQRKLMARTLAIKQIEDEKNTARVNLISSPGCDSPHSYIRLPSEVVIAEFKSFVDTHLATLSEVNDNTVKVSENVVEQIAERAPDREDADRDRRLRVAIIRALAMRNAAIEAHQIQTLVDKKTGEKWIKIFDVDRPLRQALKLAVRQTGLQVARPRGDEGGADWAILFGTREASKLFFE